MGLWDAFIDLVTNILVGIHGFCGDWGLSIIILTLCVRLIRELPVVDGIRRQ